MVGAFISSILGLIFGDPYKAGYQGARIGSLGFIDLLFYGLDLTYATTELQEPITPQSAPDSDTSSTNDIPQRHLWVFESRTINQKSLLESRENRLKIVLENLSESQLKASLQESKFWEIFRNTQEPFCKMAAEVLRPEQFECIIANAPLERQEDFAVLLTQIPKDSQDEKKRLANIIEAILPYATPWIVLTLEKQIKNIQFYNKDLYQDFNRALRKGLRQSLTDPEVHRKYNLDRTLDKGAISKLLVELPEPEPQRLTP